MCIFFCFCNTSLFQTIFCKELSKCICNFIFYKCNLFVFDCNIILCKANKCCLYSFSSFESCKFIIAKSSCNLSCSVRTEVKEDNRIIFFDCCKWCTIFYNDCWKYKFICHFIVIRCLNSCCSRLSCLAFSFNDCIVSFFHTIPTIITIHCVITSRYACNCSNTKFFHLSFKLLYIFFS